MLHSLSRWYESNKHHIYEEYGDSRSAVWCTGLGSSDFTIVGSNLAQDMDVYPRLVCCDVLCK
jgi:hypothetical protein